MSDINQLRYELQQLISRYPDLQIDLSQIRVTQSVSLMGQPVFQPQPYPPQFQPQPQPIYNTPPPAPVYTPPAYSGSMPQPIERTKLVSRPEGIEIIPPKMAPVPLAADSFPLDSKTGISRADVAENIKNESLARTARAKNNK